MSTHFFLEREKASSARHRESAYAAKTSVPPGRTIQFICFEPLVDRSCQRPGAWISTRLHHLADCLDDHFRAIHLQKVICFRGRDEARTEHLGLLLLQSGPELLEGRIGWGTRRTVEAGGE